VRLGGTEGAKTTEGKVVYSTSTDTCGRSVRLVALQQPASGIRVDSHGTDSKRVTPAELAASTIKYGNQGTIRRIGRC